MIENDGIKNLEEINSKSSFDILNYELSRRFHDYVAANGINMTFAEVCDKLSSPDVISLFVAQRDSPVTYEQFYQSMHVHRAHLRTIFHDYFERNSLDVIFYPTTPLLPVKVDDFKGPDFTIEHNGKTYVQVLKSIQNCDIGSNTNSPCITMPDRHYMSGSFPVNMEVCTVSGEDKKLIAVARRVEKVLLGQ